jgi:hypothetical protein
MDKMIAYCGLDCSVCPAYIATFKKDETELKKVAEEWSSDSMSFKVEDICCEGCTEEGRHFVWCIQGCPIRKCCIEKEIKNCAFCENYICEDLKNSLERAPDAKKNLEEIRKTI